MGSRVDNAIHHGSKKQYQDSGYNMGSRVDNAIQYNVDLTAEYEKQLVDIEKNLRLEQSEVSSSGRKEARAAFVSFKSRLGCCNCFSLVQIQIKTGEAILLDVHAFSYNELKAATNNFSSSNKIGEGGFGSVYKGKLRDGSNVAVKVLSIQSTQGDKEFMSEIASLTNITHHNLLRLYGGCINGPSRILVYEYMENNSLSYILLDNNIYNLQAWEMYKEDKLVHLVDSKLQLKNLEEAVRFLKIGLLCVQEKCSLRPHMSMANRMLSNEINIDCITVNQPALLTNIMDVKIARRGSSSHHHHHSKPSETRFLSFT
ncbi:hypothetical protein FEM48_Zijuj03G0089200 [Ziziphus jujuba var. spinosa]|uniref:Protein kinase domain-containing protein n=1 Tax=Ziziphus jujuba var. spinosa TaxID=714518 RepID=A0A978VPD1_ZIZJJ|nr:hypothetical protein FEM48_Zijuj03G0089200 [Ziziphus jujuba var. spinosa]